jgi:hypothetical protein
MLGRGFEPAERQARIAAVPSGRGDRKGARRGPHWCVKLPSRMVVTRDGGAARPDAPSSLVVESAPEGVSPAQVPHRRARVNSPHGQRRQNSLLPERDENDRSRPRQGRGSGPQRYAAMPTLIKLLATIGVIAGIGYAAMFALASLVEPRPREMVVTVPPERFVKQQH